MKGMLESLHCILDWSFLSYPSLENNVCLKLKRKEETMEASSTLILVMENG